MNDNETDINPAWNGDDPALLAKARALFDAENEAVALAFPGYRSKPWGMLGPEARLNFLARARYAA